MEQIARVVQAALKFSESIPPGDARAAEASFVAECCRDIQQVLQTRVTPGTPEADQLVDLLHQMVEKLEGYLRIMDEKTYFLGVREMLAELKGLKAKRRDDAAAAARARAQGQREDTDRRVSEAWHASQKPEHNRPALIAEDLDMAESLVRESLHRLGLKQKKKR